MHTDWKKANSKISLIWLKFPILENKASVLKEG